MGLIALGYICYLVYNKYKQFTIIKFNTIALLATIVNRIEPIKNNLKRVVNNSAPNINYLLLNAISIVDQRLYDFNKDRYADYYTTYVKEAEIAIKKYIVTEEGKKNILKQVDQYKNMLRKDLTEKQLIDLKLKQNRLKYFDLLKEIFDTKKDVSLSDFENKLIEKLNINLSALQDIIYDLNDRQSGLIFIHQGSVQISNNYFILAVSELDKDIFKLSHELSIINNSEFQKLINYSTVN